MDYFFLRTILVNKLKQKIKCLHDKFTMEVCKTDNGDNKYVQIFQTHRT